MFLAIDIGNSSIKFGVFENKILTLRFSIPTIRSYSSNQIFSQVQNTLPKKISAVAISSVVPELKKSFNDFSEEFLNVTPLIVDHKLDFGIRIDYSPPETLGIDRIVAAFAAIQQYGKPIVICDFGTATTIDAVNSNGEFLGGTIVAGINLLADALHQRTSKLPLVELKKPEKVIGNSTVSCIQSGIYFGYVGLVEGIIKRIMEELGETPQVIATGGYAGFIAESAEIIEIVNENLMLEGLRLIYEKFTAETKRHRENI